MAAYDYAGWVYKQGSMIKSWKKRYMVLQNKQLTYFENEKIEGNAKAKGSFQVITIEKAHDINNGLLVHGTGGRVMKLYTDDAQSCQGWADAIMGVTQAVPLQSSNSLPPRGGRSSSTASLRNSLVNENEDRGCTGWLAKEGGRVKNWKRRYFALNGRSLTYYDNANMSGVPKGNGQVCGVRINKDKSHSIDINFEKGRVLRVTADNKEDFEKWWACLNAAVEGRSVSRASRLSATGNSSSSFMPPPAAPASQSSTIFRSLDSYESHEDSLVAAKYVSQESTRQQISESWMSSDSDDDKEDGDWL
ncbi:unnamed protein product [Aphanomyces euteiches]|uniref:PH domain-containing protein n=1 Tax=Aphanomyces euteiches TaxID=100861 RepID=A0A6G0XAT1_9STRA|nr:hypothetical protein Ae201684_006424 [Aphanomyces euteiches]KAH9090871.1 hypothetical protein Ae201684P_006275 [Aphanomyces euteiches]KAH9146419.1 hypothetical protein AeRB84_009679 [Aphanomyces euteiches]